MKIADDWSSAKKLNNKLQTAKQTHVRSVLAWIRVLVHTGKNEEALKESPEGRSVFQLAHHTSNMFLFPQLSVMCGLSSIELSEKGSEVLRSISPGSELQFKP